MPAEGFFQRWSRLKAEPAPPVAPGGPQAVATSPLVSAAPARQPAAPPGEDAAARRPTLDDVAELHAGSDYSTFVARGVDAAVRRSALKKLFTDPHFNIGDGLDLYMGDYNKPDPIPAAMMAALRHTQSFFAQAYPEQKKAEDDPDMPGPASDDTGASILIADTEPSMADTASITSAASATSNATGEKA